MYPLSGGKTEYDTPEVIILTVCSASNPGAKIFHNIAMSLCFAVVSPQSLVPVTKRLVLSLAVLSPMVGRTVDNLSPL